MIPLPLLVATGCFSRIPVRWNDDIDRSLAARALSAFPLLGALIGFVVGGIGWGIGYLTSPLLSAAIIIALVQFLIGGTHLDGLADTADAWASIASMKDGRDRARSLEIMHQADIGPMGVIAIVIALIVQWSALASLPPIWQWVAICYTLAFSRLTTVWASHRSIPPARSHGFGALFASCTSTMRAGCVTIFTCALFLIIGSICLPEYRGYLCALLAGSIVVIVLSHLWLRRLIQRLGGVSGDIFGALIEGSGIFFTILFVLCCPFHL